MSGSDGSTVDLVLQRLEAEAPPAPADPRLFPGYEFLRELHRGGQGVVYQATQKATKRSVAVKVLREGPFADARDRARFEREVEILGRLNHPNIVVIHDSGTAGGCYYFVMDYVEGQRLNDFVRGRDLPLEGVLELVARIAEALSHAHQRGVIHRDLKPANILVDAEGNPKIVDFGLAKADALSSGVAGETMTVSGQLLGTLPYMAPEQARGSTAEIDARTDVYALGVLLYQLLTGHYPYPVMGDMAEVLNHIKETAPTPPTQRWTPEVGVTRSSSRRRRSGTCPIDHDVQIIILKALSKERERRYQTVADLAKDIRRYLSGEPIAARGDSVGYVLRKKLRRHRIGVVVASAIVLLFAAVSYFERQAKRKDAEARSSAALVITERTHRLYAEAKSESHLDPNRALQRLDEAIKAAPGFLEARTDRAFILKQLRKHTEAIDAAESILRDHPEAGAAHVLLGVLLQAHDPERAAVHRARGRALVPDDQYLLALACEPRESLEAVALLTKFLERHPDNFDAVWERTWRYFWMRDYRNMHQDTDYLIRLRPHSSQAWNLHGLALSGLGRIGDAIVAYTKSVELTHSDDASDFEQAVKMAAYHNRARVHWRLENYDEGLDDARQALALGPDRPENWLVRGMALWFHGDPDQAEEDFQRVTEIDPSRSSLVHLWLLQVHRLCARDVEALAIERNLSSVAQLDATPWERRIIAVFGNEIAPNALLADAATAGQRCEAYYYLGVKSILDRDSLGAILRFHECLSTNFLDHYEYDLARWQLTSLLSGQLGFGLVATPSYSQAW